MLGGVAAIADDVALWMLPAGLLWLLIRHALLDDIDEAVSILEDHPELLTHISSENKVFRALMEDPRVADMLGLRNAESRASSPT
jgi:hypothetical protein